MRLYKKPKESHRLLVSILLGIGVALLIFLLIPLIQIRQAPLQKTDTVEELVLAFAPPPPIAPPPITQAPESEKKIPPELDMPPPMPNLEQLELSLNPGIGGDLTIGDQVDLNFEVESASELMRLYGFDDLDEVPYIKRPGRIQYPTQLQRRKVEGFVKLLVFINPTGRVEVQKVLDYSHKEFIASAKAGAATTLFSSPMRSGHAVSAKYSWTIEFSLNN